MWGSQEACPPRPAARPLAANREPLARRGPAHATENFKRSRARTGTAGLTTETTVREDGHRSRSKEELTSSPQTACRLQRLASARSCAGSKLVAATSRLGLELGRRVSALLRCLLKLFDERDTRRSSESRICLKKNCRKREKRSAQHLRRGQVDFEMGSSQHDLLTTRV